MTQTHDVVVVGAGLAGLVATAELTAAGRRVLLLDAENRASLGGQAFWSFGGLFLVDTPEQRRLGVRDSAELALADWLGSARFADDGSDANGRAWAEAFVGFAAGPMREWFHGLGVRWFPLVQWAERGGYYPGGHGNSVPRFHVTWGTGPAVLEPFVRALLDARRAGLVEVRFRHRVTGLVTTGGRVTGVRGDVLAPDEAARAVPTSREAVGTFEVEAENVLLATGRRRRSALNDELTQPAPRGRPRVSLRMRRSPTGPTWPTSPTDSTDAGARCVHNSRDRSRPGRNACRFGLGRRRRCGSRMGSWFRSCRTGTGPDRR